MERLTIDDMKEIQLELMDELDRVCREQGITYFLAYGSLLGAVRHGGFIPWDDDMDVVMLRADYERLIAGFDEWKSSDRFSLAWYRDGKSIYSFVKLVDTTTRVLENFVDKKTSTGVWVDIFPLEDLKPGDRRPYRKNALLSLVRGFIVADRAQARCVEVRSRHRRERSRCQPGGKVGRGGRHRRHGEQNRRVSQKPVRPRRDALRRSGVPGSGGL